MMLKFKIKKKNKKLNHFGKGSAKIFSSHLPTKSGISERPAAKNVFFLIRPALCCRRFPLEPPSVCSKSTVAKKKKKVHSAFFFSSQSHPPQSIRSKNTQMPVHNAIPSSRTAETQLRVFFHWTGSLSSGCVGVGAFLNNWS